MDEFRYLAYESGRELEKVNEYLSQYIPLTASQRFFEAEDPNAETNQKSTNGAFSHIKNAIQFVKDMVSKLINTVTEWIQKMFMDKDERKKFDAFKAELAKHPEYKNKKVTLKDWRKINSSYQTACAEIDKSIQAVSNKNDAEAEAIVNKTMSTVNGILGTLSGKGLATTFAVDLAIRLAESQDKSAKTINNMLQNNSAFLKQIENELGADRAKDFQKRIRSCSHKLSLARLKARVLGKWHKTNAESMQQAVQDFKDLLNPDFSNEGLMKKAQNVRIVDDVIGSYNKKSGQHVTKTGLAKSAYGLRKGIDKWIGKGSADQTRAAMARSEKARKEADKAKWKKRREQQKHLNGVKSLLAP